MGMTSDNLAERYANRFKIDTASDLKIHCASQQRAGWDEAFAAMAEQGDDRLPDDAELPTSWDQTEWEWSAV